MSRQKGQGSGSNFPISVSVSPGDDLHEPPDSPDESPGAPPVMQSFWGSTVTPEQAAAQGRPPEAQPVVEVRTGVDDIPRAPSPHGQRASDRREAEREAQRLAAAAEAEEHARQEEKRRLSLDKEIATYRISGDGHQRSTVREKATFTLEALDDEGERVYRGGDPIFVSIQGVTRARARIDDHEDGTYTVRWRPIQSGPYKIVVSNLGKPLPGSPFICIASTPEPCPEQCQVNGSALTACMARETQNFAVSFRDQLGAVTHAVDLDVFVEPLPSSGSHGASAAESSQSPDKSVRRYMPSPSKEDAASPSKARLAAENTLFGRQSSTSKSAGAERRQRARFKEEEQHNASSSDDEINAAGVMRRSRHIRVKVLQGEEAKPLVVRAGAELDSAVLGQLLPGAIVTVMEERVMPDCTRGLVALDHICRETGNGVLTEDGETFRSNAATQRSLREQQRSASLQLAAKEAERKPSAAVNTSSAVMTEAADSCKTAGLDERRKLRLQREADRSSRIGKVGLSSSGVGSPEVKSTAVLATAKAAPAWKGATTTPVDREAARIAIRLDMANKPGHHGSSSAASVINPAATEAVKRAAASAQRRSQAIARSQDVISRSERTRSHSTFSRKGKGMITTTGSSTYARPTVASNAAFDNNGSNVIATAVSTSVVATPITRVTVNGSSLASSKGVVNNASPNQKSSPAAGARAAGVVKVASMDAISTPTRSEGNEDDANPSIVPAPTAFVPSKPAAGANEQDTQRRGAKRLDAKAASRKPKDVAVTEGFSHRDEEDEQQQEEEAVPTQGWVTLVKNGAKLVSSRLRLDTKTRRQYNEQWSRRLIYDKTLSIQAAKDKTEETTKAADKHSAAALAEHLSRSLAVELQSAQKASDQAAFAFGGVYPGTLHARGRMPDWHRVFYSVGVAGKYLLHVRLRKQAASLKGSPFLLTVRPGKAYALSTSLPKHIYGEVGGLCSTIITTGDKMGNACIEGGGEIDCPSIEEAPKLGLPEIRAKFVDQGDGTYKITWNAEKVGVFDVSVKINGLHVRNSPTKIHLTSTMPDITKCVAEGEGLVQVVKGEEGTFQLSFYDQYGNRTVQTEQFKKTFEAELAMGIAAPGTVPTGMMPRNRQAFDGRWVDGDISPAHSIYEITYVPNTAGQYAIYLWVEEAVENAEKRPFGTTPWQLSVHANAKDRVVSKEIVDSSGVAPGDYKVARPVFDEAQKKWGDCVIDSFASASTALLPRFWTRSAVAGSDGTNAFAQTWKQTDRIWAHPPPEAFEEFSRFILKPERLSEVIACVPFRPSTDWYRRIAAAANDQVKYMAGKLTRVARDAPQRCNEWPIVIFRIPAQSPKKVSSPIKLPSEAELMSSLGANGLPKTETRANAEQLAEQKPDAASEEHADVKEDEVPHEHADVKEAKAKIKTHEHVDISDDDIPIAPDPFTWLNSGVNLFEKATGIDIDGDGDVGLPGRPATADADKKSPRDGNRASNDTDASAATKATAAAAPSAESRAPDHEGSESIFSKGINFMENLTGIDIDGDGDIGLPGRSASADNNNPRPAVDVGNGQVVESKGSAAPAAPAARKVGKEHIFDARDEDGRLSVEEKMALWSSAADVS